MWSGLSIYEKAGRRFTANESIWLMIPPGSSEESIRDSLRYTLGETYGDAVNSMWQLIKGNPSKAPGAYKIVYGDKVLDVARRLKTGSQTPIRITFNNARLFPEVISKIAGHFAFSSADLTEAADTILPTHGFDRNNYIGAFLPDTYEFYWTAKPSLVIERLVNYRNKFWNEDRLKKAALLNLSPEEVEILASIVDEETAVADEKGKVGRLYINRLNKGMMLQADPTVKYAVGDFSLRRILNKHLETVSPYNTYKIKGLPPGPIRLPEKSTIDAILNSKPHNYLYMCAKEDFSGRHNFAMTLAEHNANAERYRIALNKRGIK